MSRDKDRGDPRSYTNKVGKITSFGNAGHGVSVGQGGGIDFGEVIVAGNGGDGFHVRGAAETAADLLFADDVTEDARQAVYRNLRKLRERNEPLTLSEIDEAVQAVPRLRERLPKLLLGANSAVLAAWVADLYAMFH